jgi:hypothetical protein
MTLVRILLRDGLFLFSYLNLDFAGAHLRFADFSCDLCVQLSHYYLDVGHISTNIRKLNIGFLISESDLRKSSLFYAHFFGNDGDLRILPFVFSGRFKRAQTFSGRNTARRNSCRYSYLLEKAIQFHQL